MTGRRDDDVDRVAVVFFLLACVGLCTVLLLSGVALCWLSGWLLALFGL